MSWFRRRARAALLLGLLAGPFGGLLHAQAPPADPGGSATRWSFDYVQAAVSDLVNSPLPPALGGVTIQQYFHDMGMRLWGAIALIMVVVQGLKVSMGARLDLWGLVGFLLWIAFPLMVLEGFYTPYPVFGNQTFITLVVGQGQELAAALNEAGGAFTQMFDDVNELLAGVARQLGIAFTNMGSLDGLFRGFAAVLGAVWAVSWAAVVVAVFFFFIVLASIVFYTQVVWANVAIGLLTVMGPVFVPFLLVEQLAFLFWSWFKGLLQYSLQVVVAALLLRMISSIAAFPLEGMSLFVESIASFDPAGGVDPFTHAHREVVVRVVTWVPVILAALLLSFKVGELTQIMIGGSQNLSSGLTGIAAAAAATLASGGAAVGGGLASAGLGSLSRGAAAHGMKGTAAFLQRGAQAAGRISRHARGRKASQPDQDG